MTRCMPGWKRRSPTARRRSYDAWTHAHPGAPHPSTFKIYEKEIPGEPELHCDFIFVSDGLAARIADVRVDRDTQAADHQPVILTLA